MNLFLLFFGGHLNPLLKICSMGIHIRYMYQLPRDAVTAHAAPGGSAGGVRGASPGFFVFPRCEMVHSGAFWGYFDIVFWTYHCTIHIE